MRVAQRRLLASHGKLLGVVLNRVPVEHRTYGYGYKNDMYGAVYGMYER